MLGVTYEHPQATDSFNLVIESLKKKDADEFSAAGDLFAALEVTASSQSAPATAVESPQQAVVRYFCLFRFLISIA
ncbi:unnamed protein product [Gongylonema pulchrum]|uniref:RPN13_C domain-containing protein n=1 Tax=Gongylonema pulchrum TaxID=637853 RepID=A0A183F0B6_9BILA|nr:unnamed protein product [Gongylonema pulchrum]